MSEAGKLNRCVRRSGVILARSALLCIAVLASASALAGSGRLQLTVNGVGKLDATKSFPTGSASSVAQTLAESTFTASLYAASAPNRAAARALVTSALSAQATVTASSDVSARLQKPAAGATLEGGKLVIYPKVVGSLQGNGNLTIKVTAIVSRIVGEETTASAQRSLGDQPGSDTIEFALPVAFPAGIDGGGTITYTQTVEVVATASLAASGALATASAQTSDETAAQIGGFRVFDASGKQITGFRLGTLVELTPVPEQGLAVEFYNDQFKHYFISSNPAEIANLDAGSPSGWARTGASFNVFAKPGAGLVAVCRFFSGQTFAPKSSHFYAPRGLGCEELLPTNAAWTYEDDVFYTFLPDNDGLCPAGNAPVYRLYNNGMGGAPNHRFTTSVDIQLQMQAAGYVPEGRGPGVGMCSPQ